MINICFFCRSYKNDPEILAMTNLIAAYQRNEILEFEKILKVWINSYYLSEISRFLLYDALRNN